MERIATYTVNAQITSTQLNDLQDVTVGLISGANNNVLSVPGCDGCEWQSSTASLLTATQIKVDATRDWRDRVLTVLYFAPSGSDTQPGGTNDTDYDYEVTSLRKGSVAIPATAAVLDQLACESDLVLSAMAD